MKIIELHITEFGALKNKTVSFSDGLNIIEGDNESGKSTLVLFIKFMLYGLGRKSTKNTDRERGLSFDGHIAAGSMKIECGGTQYLIERRASASSASKVTESLKLTDLSSGTTLDGEPGEVLLGVPCDVFESSSYVSQSKAATLSSTGTASAIENMLVSADESIDVSKIVDRLDKIRKEYRLNKGEGGKLYRTEQELRELKSKLIKANEGQIKAADMAAELERVEQHIKRGSDSYTASKQMLDDLTNASILLRFEELDGKCRTLEDLKAEQDALVRSVEHDGFVPDRIHTVSLSGAASTYSAAAEKLTQRKYAAESIAPLEDETLKLAGIGEQIEHTGGKSEFGKTAVKHHKTANILRILSVISFLAAAGVAIFFYPAAIALAALGIALLFVSITQTKARNRICTSFGVSFSSLDSYADKCLSALSERRVYEASSRSSHALYDAAKQDMSSAEAELTSLLSKTVSYVLCDDLYETAIREHARLQAFCTQAEQLQRDIYATDTLVSTMQKELSVYDRSALEASVRTDISTITPDAIEKARTHVRYDKERLVELSNKEKKLRETLIALRAGLTENPVELADRIAVLESKLADDTLHYNAIMLAMKHIGEASTSMTTDVTPDIARRASEMMSIISGGAHAGVQTTKSLTLSLEDKGFYIPSELLSGGTRDAAYISLRIALMYRMYGEDVPPLILDESLCQLDTARTERMLTLLAGLSQSMQCILLTCHTREKEICQRKEISANHIDFSSIV